MKQIKTSSSMNVFALRLTPQQDLQQELDNFLKEDSVEAACIVTCVGSLSRATLRLAGQTEPVVYEDKFEIVSLTGIMSHHGSHCHIALADGNGRTIGGHLMPGCLIYTTAELVIGVLPHLEFQREFDAATGYRELTIYSKLPD